MARSDIRRSAPRGRQPEPTPKSGWRRLVRRIFVWGFAFALLGAIALAVAVGLTARTLPSYQELKTSQAGQMIVVRARDGSELFSMGPSYGKWVPYAQIPQVMKDAMLSTEDKRFRSHIGIDPIGVARSFYVRYKEGRFKQGGSTITQQLARTVFLNNDRTWSRKLREIVLALALEWKFSKDQILEAYLNKVYFGGGAYGVDSAARKFFGHPGTTLSLPEAAIIAGLVKAPSHYSPTADAQAAVDRAKVVLSLMEQNGAISSSQASGVDFKAIRFASE
ncbi:MAG: transglycosylase domain-containing protein, partial [Novosphingobium sp.]